MKEVELKLVSELMKNSRRSDRQLAKALGVSQPTVSRVIRKLEKKGIIKEYTMIPDFLNIGYRLLAFTFVTHREELRQEDVEEARKIALRDMKECPSEIVFFERGLGLGYGGLIVSFHEDYSSYTRLKERIRAYSFVDSAKTESFLVSLDDKVHYRPLTLATLGLHLLKLKEADQAKHLKKRSSLSRKTGTLK